MSAMMATKKYKERGQTTTIILLYCGVCVHETKIRALVSIVRPCKRKSQTLAPLRLSKTSPRCAQPAEETNAWAHWARNKTKPSTNQQRCQSHHTRKIDAVVWAEVCVLHNSTGPIGVIFLARRGPPPSAAAAPQQSARLAQLDGSPWRRQPWRRPSTCGRILCINRYEDTH